MKRNEMTVSADVHRAVVGGVVNLCSAGALEIITREELLDIAPWHVFGAASGLAAGSALLVHTFLRGDERCSERVRKVLTYLTGGLGVADAALLTAVHTGGGFLGPDGLGGAPGMGLAAVAGTLGLSVAAWAVLALTRRHLSVRTSDEARLEDAERARKPFEKVLAEANWEKLELVGSDRFGAGMAHTVRNPPSASRYVEDDKDAPRAIANALNTITGTAYSAARVLIDAAEIAGHAVVRVLERDVLAETITAPVPITPASIHDNIPIGRFITGELVYANLHQVHTQLVGRTRSGKSSLLNRLIAHLARCKDAVMWVGGKEKVSDLVDDWMPTFPQDGLSPFDWVAAEQQGTLAMLACALHAAQSRHRTPKPDRPRGWPCEQWPAIVVLLDEASFACNDNASILCQDGIRRNASELIAAIARIGASVGVYVVLATQRGVNGEYGPEGGQIKQNVQQSFAFQCKDAAEIDFALDGNKYVNAAAISGTERRGAFYTKDSDGWPRVGKAFFLDTSEIPALSKALAGMEGRLDARTEQAISNVADGAYADRWKGSIDAFWAYLHDMDDYTPEHVNAGVVADDGGAGDAIVAAMQQEFDRVAQNVVKAYPEGRDRAADDVAQEILAGVDMDAELSALLGPGRITEPLTMRERIEQELTLADGLTNKELAARLDTSENQIRKHTAKMLSEGLAVRDADGRIRRA